ncbi:Crp/Fnr family transcriptional regulator [uncultured Phascolarctobacterium sp.]|uniref:Crp/Fnr family transcriptional regulator n=1 Tax=uncultured Phascolarctobacterium sp. TaxID=512296 RepID=UPI002629070D|nr:Crp/Fnr family transcriptional regulator [uncultured Phascolarctobacterium sp.]
MKLDELLEKYPAAKTYFEFMPKELLERYTIRTFPPGYIIHQKDYPLNYFGIIVHGDHRVINEFENGNVFMIEKNEAVDFIGEVAIMAGMEKTSVTIETLTECVAFMISREDFEMWIAKDMHFLRLIAREIAFKLYRSSYNRGAKLFYPPTYLFMDYLLKSAEQGKILEKGSFKLSKTREEIREELGMTVKTINRTIAKLKEQQQINVIGGKVTLTLAQYQSALENNKLTNDFIDERKN